MQQTIIKKLSDIESQEKVKLLFAIESGSRAWGFASRDSDYDVRFVYTRRPEWYLSIEKQRDVIEYPINNLLDINGWDIRKALGLLKKYNPALMEWLDSSIVYREEYHIRERMKEIRAAYFAKRTSMFHYLSMAKSNYREYLKGERVKVKKYFYVLRPLLACMWLKRENSHPPLFFRKLMETQLKDELEIRERIEVLLSRKIAGDELNLEPRLDDINGFIEQKIIYLQDFAQKLPPDSYCNTERLDRMFLDLLQEVWGFRL